MQLRAESTTTALAAAQAACASRAADARRLRKVQLHEEEAFGPPCLLLPRHARAVPARKACRMPSRAVPRAESFLASEEQQEAPCDRMADSAFTQELQSPTKQEIAEILDAELSPRSRQADAAGAHDDRRMVETETMRDTLDDGYRHVPPMQFPNPQGCMPA